MEDFVSKKEEAVPRDISGDRELDVVLGERSYRIRIGAGLRESVVRAVAELRRQGRPVFVVTSPAIWAAWGGFFEEVGEAGAIVHRTSCDGEQAKRAGELELLWEALAQKRVDRGGVVLAVGGGVVGDLAGFAAASYLRGVDFIQMPTTLLAMVDSAVGGKTGINLGAGKNLAGAFYQPVAVYADTAFLETLPQREFASGVAEVIKYGLLGDAALFEQLRRAGTLHWQHAQLAEIIRRCCEIKASVVSADEREKAESGGRALLNLGHTFGHAIENVAGYGTYLHGEAVAIGLMLAAKFSANLGFFDVREIGVLENLLRVNGLPVALREPLPVEALMEAMLRDKKAGAAGVKFVLLRGVGSAFTHRVADMAAVADFWRGNLP
ncbi:MAG: 3-dehydroquinate synthase [Puniceicoccales bacterium]|jgi:3-dehydroquinate synthase|nr:3-dehydroquinate synthase [Puniceicoccales bacterium]